MADRPAIAPAPAERGPRLRYVPALDGLRALAVSAVFAYHAGLGWAQGGFLGVDVFFVISGYLITALLLADWRHTGRLNLLDFWRRRARRLLPALFLMLAAVAVAVPLLAADQAHRLRGDVVAALGYFSNWRLILEEQSYFQEIGRPPVLQHLWSLAVEEQFYLLWPLVLLGLLRWRGPERLIPPIVGLAAASALLMALLHDPTEDPSRVYYGTDTRVAAILVGAALGCRPPRWRVPSRVRSGLGPARRLALEAAGVGVLFGLWRAVAAVDQFDPLLYRGGFLGVALLAAAAVALATHPRSWVTAALGCRPLVWLGKRSYAAYLWFWPVLMLSRAHHDVPLSGTPLLLLQAALTVALAAGSYRLVEQPVREGALARAWAELRQPRAGRSRPSASARRWVAGSLGAAMAITTAVVLTHPIPAPPVMVASAGTGPGNGASVMAMAAGEPRAAASAATARAGGEITAVPIDTLPIDTLPIDTLPLDGRPVGTLAAPDATADPMVVEAAVAPAPSPVPPTPAGPPVGARITAIGESVMISAQATMEAEGMYVDAAIGRHFDESLQVARAMRDAGALGEVVIVHLGNNGPVTDGQFEDLMSVLGPSRRVLVVTVRVPRPWETHNNRLFAEAVPHHANAVLVDWHSVGDSHPEVFGDDGVHMTHAGVAIYMSLLHAGM